MIIDREFIKAKVGLLVSKQLGVDISRVLSANFADLGANSLDMVEIIMAVEEEFDIQIPEEERPAFLTGLRLEALADYLVKLMESSY